MRLSVDRSDRGYNPAAGLVASVLLNGKEIKWCITADEEARTALCYATDAQGRLLKPAKDSDALPTVTLIGEVKIVVPDEHKHLLTLKFT